MESFLSLEHIFFTLGGQGVSYLEFTAVICGLTAVALASLNKVSNFYLNILYCFLLFLMFLQRNLYTSMLLQPVSLGIVIFGLYRWTHPSKQEQDEKKRLKISYLNAKERLVLLLIMVAFGLGWGFFLSRIHTLWPIFPQARMPYLDAFVAAVMLVAQYLAAQKKWECWLCWLVVNCCNIVLYTRSGLVFMPIVAACYIGLNVLGVRVWLKEWKNQEEIC